MTNRLEDMKINVKIKLAALWITVMFLYAYVDILGMYQPGQIENIMAGVFQFTQVGLVGAILLMAIPILMVFLSLVLKAKANRWVNIILGISHIGLALSSILIGESWAFYIFGSILEAVLLSLIVWYAWKWPTQKV